MALPTSTATATATPTSLDAALDEHLEQSRAGKVEIATKSIGNAPPLKHSKYSMDANMTVADFVRLLKMKLQRDSIHVYVNDAFEPRMEEKLADLKNCFAISNRLSLSYSLDHAFN